MAMSPFFALFQLRPSYDPSNSGVSFFKLVTRFDHSKLRAWFRVLVV
jgi:hypothetical protein